MYKFRRTIKLDDYSGATVEILVDSENKLSVRVTDLVGDAWHEFLEALSRAEAFQQQGKAHDTNREIQLALTKLSTHLDGVVSGMCKSLKESLSDFKPPEYGKHRDCSLPQKIKYLTDYVRNARRLPLPTLDLRFKVLRDILIHPYADKYLQHGRRRNKTRISQCDIFDVTINDLMVAKSSVDEWLGTVTDLFKYPRGYHTRELAEDFSAKLIREYRKHGGVLPPDSEIKSQTYRI